MADERNEINIYLDKDYVSRTYSLTIAQKEAIVSLGKNEKVKIRCFNAVEEHGVRFKITAFSPNATKTPNVGGDYFSNWSERERVVGSRSGGSGPKRKDITLKPKRSTGKYFYYGVKAYREDTGALLDKIDPKLRIDNGDLIPPRASRKK